jgi:alkylation response protein AidB-like acyl-CoA dehydrogenase
MSGTTNLDSTEEQEMLITSARDFLTSECPKTLVRGLEQSEKGYYPELWEKMEAPHGLAHISLPEGILITTVSLAILGIHVRS